MKCMQERLSQRVGTQWHETVGMCAGLAGSWKRVCTLYIEFERMWKFPCLKHCMYMELNDPHRCHMHFCVKCARVPLLSLFVCL
jgi:hypothetical protein